MPSTPTSRLRVETQALGENLNTWGDTRLNEALKRLEEGIAGVANIVISGASTTLTSVNYSADQARNACLVFTGTLTANSVVIVPNVEKLYLCVNLTSGAFSLTVKTAAGTGYALRAGPQWVRCDGTDVSSATPRLDQLPLPTAAMDLNGQRLTNIPATPSALTDAASKSYVDTVAGGAAAQYFPADGSGAAPAYSFASDTNTGIYRVAENSLGIATGGTTRLTVAEKSSFSLTTASDDGTAQLTIASNRNGTTNPTTPSLRLQNFAPSIAFRDMSSGHETKDVHLIRDSNVLSVRWDSLGDGTAMTTPLQVDVSSGLTTITGTHRAGAGTVGTPAYSFSTDPDTGLYSSSANSLGFSVGGAVGMTLNGSGDLGLGQTPINNSGYRTITVGDTAGGAIELTNSGTMKGRLFYETSTDNLFLSNHTADGELVFSTGGSTARMWLMSSGDLRIGQLSSSTPGIANTVTGFSLQQGGRLFSSAAGGSAFNLNADGQVMSWARSGVIVGGVSVTTTATTYATSSDYRLKENVEPLADACARLARLKPSRFNFIADPGRRVDGFLAHEAQEVVPEAVVGEKDGEAMQSIDQSKLIPLLTAAIQELMARVAELEAK